MAAMPDSPRPTPGGDDGVYRSIFQQPLLEIPPRAPPYAWFEFLLHPDALERHLDKLRDQQACGGHGATSAMELVREFLDQAQLVAMDGNESNQRYRALLRVAAHVALEMHLPLVDVERDLPLHFQRLLLDAIVEFADVQGEDVEMKSSSATASITTRDVRLMHDRWTLRTLAREAQNGYLTSTNKSDAEELMAGFQSALQDLSASHSLIAQRVLTTLVGSNDGHGEHHTDSTSWTLRAQTQFDAFFDLAVYFFTVSAFEKAYECFSRALEIVEEHGKDGDDGENASNAKKKKLLIVVTRETRATLEGYLAACEAVMEARAANAPPLVENAAEARSRSKPLHMQVSDAFAAQDWGTLVELLQADLVSDDTVGQCQPGQREALELDALRLLRHVCLRRSGGANGESDAKQGELSAHGVRSMYKQVAIGNALHHALLNADVTKMMPSSPPLEHATASSQEAQLSLCVITRLLQEELFWLGSERTAMADDTVSSMVSGSLFADLTAFTVRLIAFLVRHPRTSTEQRDMLLHLTQRLVHYLPCMRAVDRVERLLAPLPLTLPATRREQSSLTAVVNLESSLRVAGKRQRDHFSCAKELVGVITGASTTDKDAILALLRESVPTELLASLGGTSDVRNLVLFCTLNNQWEVLMNWRAAMGKKDNASLVEDTRLAAILDVALSSNALVRYVTMTLDNASGGSTEAAGSTTASTSVAFTVTRCNQLVTDLLAHRRALLAAMPPTHRGNSNEEDGEEDERAWLVDLPLWLLESIVCICAGLLHRAATRNLSDRRVSFDLNPYGDIALIVAFAPEPSSRGASKKEDTSTEDGESSASKDGDVDMAEPDPTMATTTFLKASLADIAVLHARGVRCLLRRCPREPRWLSASADLALHPMGRLKQPALSDPRAALRGYLVAASLATNYFSDSASIVDVLDQSSLVRLTQCLMKLGAPVAAAVLYQCFPLEEAKYGLRILQLTPDTHDPAFFQYFWELPYLELLVHLHSGSKHYNERNVTLLTHLIQSPELNSCNPVSVQHDVQQRILRCFFRDLCRNYLC